MMKTLEVRFNPDLPDDGYTLYEIVRNDEVYASKFFRSKEELEIRLAVIGLEITDPMLVEPYYYQNVFYKNTIRYKVSEIKKESA